MSGWVFEVCAVNGHEVSNSPLVSVGIPTYKRPEGLRRTLECITSQTYKNLEIVVSDNCSPGVETESVVREFIARDCRIQYYRQEENKGSFFNFKFVLEKATGEYFMWAADDDEWELFYVERIINEFQSFAEDFIAITLEAQYIDEKNKKFDYFSEGRAFYHFQSRSITSRLMHILKFNYGNLVYSIYRMSSLKKIQNVIFVENEIPFMLQVMQYGNWRVIPEVGFYKKTNNSTYIQAKWEMCGGWLRNPNIPILDVARKTCYSLRYHWIASKNIKSSIDSLTLSGSEKLFLKIYTQWTISVHFFNIVFGYKPPKFTLKRGT